MTAYLLERAWVGDRFLDDVLVEVEDGRFTSVTPDSDPPRAGSNDAWRPGKWKA